MFVYEECSCLQCSNDELYEEKSPIKKCIRFLNSWRLKTSLQVLLGGAILVLFRGSLSVVLPFMSIEEDPFVRKIFLKEQQRVPSSEARDNRPLHPTFGELQTFGYHWSDTVQNYDLTEKDFWRENSSLNLEDATIFGSLDETPVQRAEKNVLHRELLTDESSEDWENINTEILSDADENITLSLLNFFETDNTSKNSIGNFTDNDVILGILYNDFNITQSDEESDMHYYNNMNNINLKKRISKKEFSKDDIIDSNSDKRVLNLTSANTFNTSSKQTNDAKKLEILHFQTSSEKSLDYNSSSVEFPNLYENSKEINSRYDSSDEILIPSVYMRIFPLRQSDNAEVFSRANTSNIPVYSKNDYENHLPKPSTRLILASVYYGLPLGNLIGGWGADRWGGRSVLLISVFFAAVANFLIPWMISINAWSLFLMRFMQGFFVGLGTPISSYLMARWGTSSDLNLLLGLCHTGSSLGMALALPITSYICHKGGGWRNVFYVSGLFGSVWVLFAYVCLQNSPAEHPLISENEYMYIRRKGSSDLMIRKKKRNRKDPPPKMPLPMALSNRAVIASFFANFCASFSRFLFVILQPKFMNEMFGFKQNQPGMWWTLPWGAEVPLCVFVGGLLDMLVKKGALSLTTIRKIFNTAGMLISSVSPIILIELPREYSGMASYGLLLLGVGNVLTAVGGHLYTPVTLVPSRAATVMGVSNAIGSLTASLSPILVHKITLTGTKSEWRAVFWGSAGLYIVGGLVFLVFGSAKYVPFDVKKSNNRVRTEDLQHNNRTDINACIRYGHAVSSSPRDVANAPHVEDPLLI